ncbi:unnamed protein product [Amoebophrya sp. A120]|nr:unnamed protein product [Amoebophrya sp. A120]|eukprot:GSA120T00008420001.1
MPVHWNEDLEDYYETFTGKPVVPCYEKFCDAAANLGIKVNQLLKHRAKEVGRCCKLFNLLDERAGTWLRKIHHQIFSGQPRAREG